MSVDDPAHTPRSVSAVENLAAGLQAMQTHLAGMVEESKALRRDINAAEEGRKAAERSSRRATGLALALLAALIVLAGMSVVITWQNNAVVHKVNETNSVISDCTTPSGKCYQQGSARTSEAIASIIRAEIYMAQCARMFPGESGPAYDRKLESCVYGRLAASAAAQAAPSPSPSGR